jgi:hypothetical protein
MIYRIRTRRDTCYTGSDHEEGRNDRKQGQGLNAWDCGPHLADGAEGRAHDDGLVPELLVVVEDLAHLPPACSASAATVLSKRRHRGALFSKAVIHRFHSPRAV